MLGQLGRRTRRQSESNRKESREHIRILKIKRKDGATERRSDGNRLAVRTCLKPAHTWNRHASLKHFIEQNDESPRGHPGHSTMARPSGPNAGSAHVLRARITPRTCKKSKKEARPHTESADPHRPCPPIGPMLLLISSRTPSAATSHGSCWSGTRTPYRTWKRPVLKK